MIPGGTSTPMVGGEAMVAGTAMMEVTMDYDSISKAGSALGAGSVIIIDDSVCIVKTVERIARFYMHESCGQCTPCREGMGWLWRVMRSTVFTMQTLSSMIITEPAPSAEPALEMES